MPCDTRLKRRRDGSVQKISERADEIKAVVEKLSTGLVSGRVKAKVGPQGAIAFVGLTDEERDGVSDNCAYRRLMVYGSALAKAAITRAEQIAGRTVDKQMVAAGAHSHDGGNTWHSHKG